MQNDLGFSSEHISRALNNYQRNFPLVARPFAFIGNELDLSEEQTIQLFQKLKEENKITRIGPVFKPNTLGASTLAAMQVPAECLVKIASFVSSLPEVNHNYERENILNLWFVVTAPDSEKLTAVLKHIEQHTHIKVHELRLEEEFRIDLGFNLTATEKNYAIDRCEVTATEALEEKARRLATSKSHKPTTKTIKVPLISDLSINNYSGRTISDTSYSENPSTGFQNNFSEKLIAEIEKGLPLTAEPYNDIAIKLSVSEADVMAAISYLQSTEVIRRFGVVVRHRELGYTSNAMVVWNIPDETVSQIGRDIVNNPSFQFVSLCYKRSRSLPEWNYNFYCMIHGKNRDEVLAHIQQLITNMNMQGFKKEILFSQTCFKQKGARYSKFNKQESEKLLLNLLQEGIPVTDEPYQDIAKQTGFTEDEILSYIQTWLNDGTLSRFGPMFNVEKFGGEFTLVAMQVPTERFEAVNSFINSLTEVAHNYEREHQLNMWFVLATSEPSQTNTILKLIEETTQLRTFSLPKMEEYYLNLRFQA